MFGDVFSFYFIGTGSSFGAFQSSCFVLNKPDKLHRAAPCLLPCWARVMLKSLAIFHYDHTDVHGSASWSRWHEMKFTELD